MVSSVGHPSSLSRKLPGAHSRTARNSHSRVPNLQDRTTPSRARISPRAATPSTRSHVALAMTSSPGTASPQGPQDGKRGPVVLFDVMDTLVTDPFHFHIPNFFGLSMRELLDQKHPTAWIDFEKGRMTEKELHEIFFNDGRDFDMQGLKAVMKEAYGWVDGMQCLLQVLKQHGVEMHAFTNYPDWYLMIEDKLALSQYMDWTFVSCHTGLRKPDVSAYEKAALHLGVDPVNCIFIDDRKVNVTAAESAGMRGIHFASAEQVSSELSSLLGLPTLVQVGEGSSPH